jgi:hypothetical protein
MKVFDNLKIVVRFVLLLLLSWFLLSCNTLRQQAKFYKQNPHLIPTLNQQVQKTMYTAPDTLTGATSIDISKPTDIDGHPYPITRMYTFENKKTKTTIAVNIGAASTDSLPIEVQTIVKPDTLTLDTTIAYKQYQFTATPPKPKSSWQRWSNRLFLFTGALFAALVLVLVSLFKRP